MMKTQDNIRLGQCVNLTHAMWVDLNKIPLNDKENFKKEVKGLFFLINEVEAELQKELQDNMVVSPVDTSKFKVR